ncbi:MAG: RNA polymerase sigma factor [Bacteroidota bacterium]
MYKTAWSFAQLAVYRNSLEEKELISALCEGREEAFKELFKLFSDRIYNTALSVLQHQEDAEDITQEVFVEVFRSVKNFRQDASLSTWIYKVTVSKCTDHLKKSKAKKRFAFLSSLFGDDNDLQHDKPHFEHPGVLMEHKEHSKVLFFALQKLPEKQQLAYTLAKIEGLSYAEVAASMGTSVSSVESLLFRANDNLRSLLSEYYKNNIQGGARSLLSFLLTL